MTLDEKLDIAKNYSKASRQRLSTFAHLLLKLDERKIDGDVVECGVWRGGHVILARLVSPHRLCWAYDTYEGMPEPGPHDRKRSGDKPPPDKAKSKKWTMASIEEVQENMRATGTLDHMKIVFVRGMVEETLWQRTPSKIAMLRLDTDWYASTKVELEMLWPRLVKGGYLLIDDYGHWMGAKKAVDEFFQTRDPSYIQRLQTIDYTGVWLQKR